MFRQRGCVGCNQQRPFSKCAYKRCLGQNLSPPIGCPYFFKSGVRGEQSQHCRCPFLWRYCRFSQRFSPSIGQDILSLAIPYCQPPITVMTCISSTEPVIILMSGQLQLKPSPLQPDCRAEERIFQWRG